MSERRESFEVGAEPRIEVRISSGRVSVEHHERGGVEVNVEGKHPEGFIIERYGDGISIRQSSDGGLFQGSYRVALRVPDDAEIDVAVASADVSVIGTVRALRATTASGDVSARTIEGDLMVKTASGEIDVEEIGGRAQITSASGDVSVGALLRHCKVSTASGDLEIGTVSGDARIKTASGDVEIGRFLGGEIDCKTVSGDVVVGIPAGRRVQADLHTMSGSVQLPDDRLPAADDADAERASIQISSVSGDIRLTRSD